MSTPFPLSSEQQRQIIDETTNFIHRAEEIFNRKFDIIPVTFDLKGRAAGMYRVKKKSGQIRYNPYIFAKYFDDNLAVTVPHEVAHYVVDAVYGMKNIRPHGKQWKLLMDRFGVDASRTCSYDLSGIPLRTARRHTYNCACSAHKLTSIRHNKIQRGAARYFCKSCRKELVQVSPKP